MIKKTPFKIWFFVFSLLFFGVSLYRLPGVGAETDTTLLDRYDAENVSLRKAVVTYHKDINNFFNESIELLLSGDSDVDVDPPPDGKCYDENVSTFCVSLRAVDYYDAFRQDLLKTHLVRYVDEFKDDMSDAEKISFFNTEDRSAYRMDKLTDNYNERRQLIYDQIDIAQKALDTTLAAYNELFLFYNLHQHYLTLIEDLENYRDQLANFRGQVEQYPSAFHNRMTTDCK